MTQATSFLGFAATNVIAGTDDRDNIVGTSEADYIIAGGGQDFYLLGGEGADAFEVNYGDDIVRIADFELGQDMIVLNDQSVLEGATFTQTGTRFDIRLSDGTLVRIDNATEADIGQIFTFKDDVPSDSIDTGGFDPDSTANLIEGTDGSDKIFGSDGDDYIIAGSGQDFWVEGGAGADTFEVNLGDDVVRIVDFEVSQDKIALADESVLDNATITQNGTRLDIRLEDNTLLRVDNVTEADLDDMFVFRSETDSGVDNDAGDDAGSDTGGDTDSGTDSDTGDTTGGDAPTDAPDVADPVDTPDVADPVDTPDVTDPVVPADPVDPPADEDPADPPAAAENPLKIVIFGGQSLAFGATGRDWVNTGPQYENSLMLDFDNPQNGARGWETGTVDNDAFNGFTQRYEVAQETPATGAMNVLAEANPDTTFVSLHYGQSGKSLDYIRENTLDGLTGQLELIKAHADSMGYTIDPQIELVWIQGQSGSEGDYSDGLSAHLDEVQDFAASIFGSEFDVNMYSTIVRGFGGKTTTGEQFQAIQDDPDIFLGSTEWMFNAQYPAKGQASNAHLTGEGYYMMGTQIGTHIQANMEGNPVAPITIEAVRSMGGNTFQVDFANVVGQLQSNPDVYADDDFIGTPDNFGLGIYRSNQGSAPGEIVSAHIVDADTIEFTYSEELAGTYNLWVGRNDSDGWMADGGGRGWGGTTLYDNGQSFTATDPVNGLNLQTDTLYEFIPQQYFEFEF